jgi:hypothetical protein
MTIIDVVREAVLAAGPGITETEKWNAPNFVYDGVDRVTMRVPPKGGLQLIFHRGAKVRDDVAVFSFDDPTGRLTWPARDRGILSLSDEADAAASAAQITELVRLWVATA